MPPPARKPESAQLQARNDLLDRIVAVATSDSRILAVLDYGSTSEGRGNAWSDIDLAILIRPDAWDEFNASWRHWLESCGPVLLGFISFVGHPWAVIATDAAPVRVDLHLYGDAPDHDLVTALREWPNSPTSVEAMLLFDRDNALAEHVAPMIGRSLAPMDLDETFASASAHFWYYVHRAWSKLQRDSDWGTRWNLTFIVTGNLCALLRLESGAIDRWTASDAADGIESAVSPQRLAQLQRCIPSPDAESLAPALRASAELGAEVCASIASRTGQSRPEDLAREMIRLLD
jgi:hypothetical protein